MKAFNERFIVLSRLINRKLKIENEMLEKYKKMDEDFGQNHFS